MNSQEMIASIIERIVVSLPFVVVILTSVMYSLNNIKKVTSAFPLEVENTRKSFVDQNDVTKKEITGFLTNTQNELLKTFETFSSDFLDKTDKVLLGMETELHLYQERLDKMQKRATILAIENKAYLEIILSLISQDPESVKKGVATKVSKIIEEMLVSENHEESK